MKDESRRENDLELKEIKTVSIVGLGSLGIMYGHHILNRIDRENLRIVADENQRENIKTSSFIATMSLVILIIHVQM